MTTLTAALDSIVGLAYEDTPKTNAITTALLYISSRRREPVLDGDSDNTDFLAAQFAAEILNNATNHQKSFNDPTIQVKSLDELWTPEMEELLFGEVEERTISIKNQNPSQFAPGRRWQDGGSQASG